MTNLRLSVSYLDLHSQLAEGSRHNSRCAMASVAVAVRAAGGGPQRVARVIAAPSREETGEECAVDPVALGPAAASLSRSRDYKAAKAILTMFDFSFPKVQAIFRKSADEEGGRGERVWGKGVTRAP